MSTKPPLRIYIVTGEASGDALGANIITSLNEMKVDYQLGGLAGPKMQALGAKSLFDVSQLSVMGFTAVMAKLPSIYKLGRRVVDDAISFDPDVVVLIDSPDFNMGVAKRLKKRNAAIRVVKYICPSVWAWRPGRAAKMNGIFDHVLAILPFEPDLMKKLGGPETTYVGHPLSAELAQFSKKNRAQPAEPLNLLILPGSRMGEVKRLLPIIGETLDILHQRGVKFNAVLPAVAHLAQTITTQTEGWSVKPDIVVGKKAKQQAFQSADLALACSGTVLLELGMSGIPTISIYKLDALGFIVKRMVYAWTASLPNLIVDRVIIPERFEEFAQPPAIARELQQLAIKGPMRDAQIQGFKKLREIMQQDAKNLHLAATKIVELADGHQTHRPK